jgi:hypothetical protein
MLFACENIPAPLCHRWREAPDYLQTAAVRAALELAGGSLPYEDIIL